MIILDNEYVLIEHDTAYQIVNTVWKKYTPSAAYRQIIITRFEAILSRQIHKELSDLSLLPTISQEDANWTVETSQLYYSRICRNSTQIGALILAEGTFTRLAMNNMMEEFRHVFKGMDNTLITKYFNDVQQARNWLINQSL